MYETDALPTEPRKLQPSKSFANTIHFSPAATALPGKKRAPGEPGYRKRMGDIWLT